jgi:DNA recombination protein RmuC|tara:strand:- start:4693 stop:6045 length:1353 start_codon:yes stop_codon:yes gene_type:complete
MGIAGYNLIFIFGSFIVGVAVTLLAFRVNNHYKQTAYDLVVKNLTHELSVTRDMLASREKDIVLLGSNKTALEVRLESDKIRYEEQLALLKQARESLSQEFENLANRIFDAKQEKFSQESKLALSSSIDPLREEITGFRKQVEEAYHNENANRNKLIGQVVELQKQAQQVGEDAVQLASALKGDSKFQGNWGEVVLERLLEDSGLTKGREYVVQSSHYNDEGHRRNPDVIIHMPDQKDLVIDAKVSLTDYERYCRASDSKEKQLFLKQHVNSIRNHISGLSRKAYEQLEGINTLDFVLIFVPIEGAFMLALQNDDTLCKDAYDKGILLVSPSTLLVVLKTVHNVWRYDKQNRNAERIAIEAGKLYDQLALVVDSLDEVGRHIGKSQDAWDQAKNRLVSGRGNLVKRFDDIRNLGAHSKRKIPETWSKEALNQEDTSLLQADAGQKDDLKI